MKPHLRWLQKYSPQCLLGEENVQGFSVIGVGLSVEEHPVLLEKDLGCRVDEAWFSVVWRVEDFSGHLVGRAKDDEAGVSSKQKGRGQTVTK